MTGPGGVERIDAKIEGWRRSLLDLTRRNPLSSFRISDRSRRQLELVEPEAAALFDRLTSPGQRCDIYYREPEPGEQETDAEPVPRLARVGEVRTGRDAAVNWRTLYTIEKKAREFEQEQGVNVLFVACGFLQWPEAQDPEQTRLAPLLLVPVSLTDEPQHSRYSLGMVDDEPLVNPVLVRLLQSDFRLGLPEFALPENGPEGALQAWLEEVDEIAAGREGWSVTRRCFLGLFSFLKLAMYEDLDRCRAEAAAHPLVRALAGDTEALAPLVEAPLALPLPEDLDAQVPPLDCYQILDADASQQVAIEAAKRGQSFILHGPPGTGKSQTIANLIAEFLAAGKTILFVSEKMAALDVVWRHLERHHLADFCLPLHSHQAQKSEVYRLLGRSLEGVRQLAGPDTPDDAALMAMRIRLNEHAKQLNEPVPPLGWTPVRACGEVARLEQAPALAFAFDDADQLDRVRYDDIRQHLAALEPVYQVLLRAKGHPWRGTAADLHVDEATLTARLRALSEGLAAQQDASAALAEACGLDAPGTLAELELLCQRADVLAESPRPPSAWLLDRDLTKVRENARLAAELSRRHLGRTAALIAAASSAFMSLDHARLAAALKPPALVARMRETADAEAGFSKGGRELCERLASTARAVRDVLHACAPIAEVLDRGVPDTLQQAHDVVADGQLCSVAAPLCPLWFEPAQRPLAAALAETGGKLAAAAAEGRRRLEVSAATALIQADSAGLLDRLLGTSRPIVGVFYRRRRRRLLAEVGQVLGRDTPPALEEASALLAAARAVAVASDWLVASESEAQRLLGAWFVGPRTDWPGVAEALGTCPAVAALLDRCRSDDCRQSLSALLYERPAARSALAEAAQRADACLAAAEGALQALDAELALSAANDLYVEPLAQLAQTLDAEAEAARAYLDAYDKAGACYGFSLDPGATSPGLVRGHLQEALDLADERRNGRLATNSGPLRQEFGDLFADYDTDWDAVAGALDWAAELRCAFADAVPHAVAVVASGPVEGLIRVRQCRQAVGQLRADLAPAFGALGTWFPQGVDGRPMADVAMTALHDRVRACLADVPGRRAWLSLQHWQERAARLGLAPFIAELADAGIPFGNAQPAFWRRFWQLWLEAVAQQRPWLWPNEALDLPASVSRFQSADRQLIASGCVRVRRRLSERRQSTGVGSVQGGGIGLISREVGKKRRQKPLRVLLREAGFAVQQLRPCFLMSPLSVATYLGDPSMRFDVVIFDEASQVRTQDAVGAILRGRQLIVAGDERQLPPTSFFQTSLDDDEHEPEEQQVDNYDSVLDELGSSGLDRHRLHWHYRSRREGLIVFSNRHIYDDDPLQTFPEPEQGAKADPAVTWVHVPAGRYRGRLGNAEEASVVARLVVDHYRARPDRSMGVIAFGQSHQQAIEEALRAALRADPELHGYFTGDRLEPFFVKNLETVQGDERDAIILTVGYGRGPDGQLRRFYGPLNNEGGERRLNVAITRAKHQLTVVSSVLADELAVDDSKHRGPKLLRDYLRYAETGWLDRVDAGTDAFDSPLEVSVCEALRERGLLVETQIGCSGYRIDMAIRDPDTGRYLLGIECDGAMYHRAKTARDRDRLRQEVLEQRGWRLLRIWSTDWLRSNGSQIDRVFAALEEGPQPPPLPLAGPLPPPTAPPPLPPTTEPEPPVDSGPDASVPGTVPYRKWDPPHQLLHPELFYDDLNLVAKLVSTVVATEGPVSLSLTTERLCEAFGFDRAGERIREQVRAAARLSAGDERLRKDGLFLWPKDLATAPVRRPAAGEQPRAIADIPPDEVREAAALIVRGAGGIDAEALVTQTSRLLGYQRTGQNIAHAVQAAIAGLDRDPRFERRGGLYYPIGAVDAVRVAADATHQPLHDTPPLPERPGWQWLRNAWLFSSPDRSRTAYIFPVAGRQFWVHLDGFGGKSKPFSTEAAAFRYADEQLTRLCPAADDPPHGDSGLS